MPDAAGSIMDFINYFLFTGFGVFTMVWLLVSAFRKGDSVLDGIDNAGTRLIAVAGLAYFGLWACWLVIILAGDNHAGDGLRDRLYGPYGYSIWLHPVAYLVLTQLLWFGRVRRMKPLRFIIGFLLMFSIEKFVIATVSFHRDYTPDDWFSGYFIEMLFYGLLGLAISGIVFTVFAGLLYLFSRKFTLRIN